MRVGDLPNGPDRNFEGPLAQLQKIVVVDDHPILTAALADLTERQIGNVTVTALTCAKPADLADATLALIDVYLPGDNGIDLIRNANALNPKPILIAISGDDSYATQYEAFAAGAQAFISKSADPDRIAALLLFLLGRSSTIPHLLDSGLALGQPAVKPTQRALELSSRDREIIMLIGQGLANEAIAQTLGLSVNTVKQHVTRLLSSHGVENRTQLLKAASPRLRDGIHADAPSIP